MVAKHHGRYFELQKLREKSAIGKQGVNLLGLSDAAEDIGFRSKAVKLSLEQLCNNAPLPCILHWEQEHFVVLYKYKKNKFYIADPARGLITYTENEFKGKWLRVMTSENQKEGVALLLEPTNSFFDHENITPSSELKLKNIVRYMKPYKRMISQLLIGLIVSSFIQLLLPLLTQNIIDTGINTENVSFIFLILLGQLALLLGRLMIEFIRGWILLHISARLNVSILTDFLIKLLKLPINFFDSKRTGDILQRINDHQRIESFLTGSSLNTIFSIFNLLVFSGVLLYYNSTIFIVFILATVIYSFWAVVFLNKRRELDHKKFALSAQEQGLTIQLIQGMQEIKLNACERQMRWSWENLQVKLLSLNIRGLALNQYQSFGAFFINEGKNVIVTFLAARAVIDHHITLGSMLAIQYIIGQLNSPIEQIIGFIQSYQSASISIDRLNEIHKLPDEEDTNDLYDNLSVSLTKSLTGGRAENRDTADFILNASQDIGAEHQNILDQSYYQPPSITFNDLSFTYQGAGNQPILNNIDFFIPSGKTTAIVGTSGSGKTTLLKLILKFYKPDSGNIKLNDLSFEHISHREWRQQCGVVMQDSFIFNYSIAKNIAIGVEKIDVNLLLKAIKIANLDDFIAKLPFGINTKIGAEGTGISAGQRQRILIARAIYKNPKVILFDEATNSLDANNETVIMRNLDNFFKGRTVVVVAHRLSTIKNADQIIVLNNGRISEQGTHTDLITKKGEYYKLIKNQLELGN